MEGNQTRGTTGQANELQVLVNQEARATTGYLRTTNLGGFLDRFRTQTGGSPAGEQAATVRSTVTQPTAG